MSPAGTWVTNNSKVSDAQKNYSSLTYEGINPPSVPMARRCVFKYHKNLPFFTHLIAFYNFARFIKRRFSGGGGMSVFLLFAGRMWSLESFYII